MKAEEYLDYLINALQSLLDENKIDFNEFYIVCEYDEARKELKRIIEMEIICK